MQALQAIEASRASKFVIFNENQAKQLVLIGLSNFIDYYLLFYINELPLQSYF